MDSQEIQQYVGDHAPELNPDDVVAFMQAHSKPEDEPGSHVEWATRILRQRGEGEFGDGLSPDRVADELRRRDR